MSGIQCFFRRFDHRIDRNFSDYNLHFHFGKKVGIEFHTSVFFSGSFLYSASHDLCHCNSGYSQVVQCCLQCIKLRKPADNADLMHSCIIYTIHTRLLTDHFDCGIHLSFGCLFIIILPQIRVFIDIHIHAGHIINRES